MRKKILLNYIIILVVSALITGALSFYFIGNNYASGKEEKLVTNIALIDEILREGYSYEKQVNFYRLAQELSKKTNSRVTFINKDGHAIADSINNSIIFHDFSLSEEFRNALKGSQAIVRRYSRETGEKYFYLAAWPIKVGNRDVILRIGDSYDEIDHITEEFLTYFGIVLVLNVGFALVLSYYSSKKITQPIKELEMASQQMIEGEFDYKIMVKSKDEIGRLADTFNDMAEELKYTIEKLKKKNMEQETILSSIQDGILAVDLDGKIILINDSIKRILDTSQEIEIGDSLKTILGDICHLPEDEIRKIRRPGYYNEIKPKDTNKIISIESHTLNDIYDLRVDGGILVVFRDITSIRKLEKMSNDFVANVSHELRTPLTSIMGFIETLKTRKLDKKSQDRALNIIEEETEKLLDMINELLILSKIEGMTAKKETEDICIKGLISEVLDLLKLQIKTKEITVETFVEDKLNKVRADEELIRLILVNLLENSIKYSKSSGKVKISVLNYGRGIKLIVEDNGMGIAEQDLPWIFQRFYRASESRKIDSKGYGLGLAIVKEVVNFLDGSIKVESKLRKGSKFTVKLPN